MFGLGTLGPQILSTNAVDLHSSDDGACLQPALSFTAAIESESFIKPKRAHARTLIPK